MKMLAINEYDKADGVSYRTEVLRFISFYLITVYTDYFTLGETVNSAPSIFPRTSILKLLKFAFCITPLVTS